MRILLAPDKFKTTLDATSVAEAMALGVRDTFPDADVRVHPLADGGEGSLDCVAAAGTGSFVTVPAEDSVGAPVTARAFEDGSTVMVAAHETQLLAARPTPAVALRASSRGLGVVMLAALAAFPGRAVVVWVGGTASTDGGAGAAQAAGWRLLDARGRDVGPGGAELRRLDRVVPPEEPFGARVTGACDVVNTLLGDRGAARVFSAQKGARPADMQLLEDGLERLADCIRTDLGIDVASLPYGGAGGGIGAGLTAFFGADLEDGFMRIANETRLDAALAWADAVVTGEGRVDAGSLGGKVTSNVARLCKHAGKRCLVVTGEVALPAALESAEEMIGADAVVSTVDRCGRERSFRDPAACVRAVTAELVRERIAPT
ncbi:MAG TPA: glycerate kinase [Actinomycetota bacterium]|nr:glycerate kinase [Actinomycetota bacterium]